MGAFETRAARANPLPTDLPDATEVAATHPDGAVYKANSGQRYRLRHARWVEVVSRKKSSK